MGLQHWHICLLTVIQFSIGAVADHVIKDGADVTCSPQASVTVGDCVTLVTVQFQHQAITLTPEETRAVLSHTDLDQMWQRDLRPLLVTRYPGSTGSHAVQEVSVQVYIYLILSDG